MTLVDITLVEGRSPEVRQQVLEEVATTLARILQVSKSSVQVLLREVPASNYRQGTGEGKPKPLPETLDLVEPEMEILNLKLQAPRNGNGSHGADHSDASGSSERMETFLQQASEFLEGEGWVFTRLGERTILRLGFEGENGRWVCYAQVRGEPDQFVFYSVFPKTCPDFIRPRMSEFLTRANYGLLLGNFEFDFDDGEIRFKTSVDIQKLDSVVGLLGPLIYVNCLMMDRYFPGIMEVMDSSLPPREILNRIED